MKEGKVRRKEERKKERKEGGKCRQEGRKEEREETKKGRKQGRKHEIRKGKEWVSRHLPYFSHHNMMFALKVTQRTARGDTCIFDVSRRQINARPLK